MTKYGIEPSCNGTNLVTEMLLKMLSYGMFKTSGKNDIIWAEDFGFDTTNS